MFLHFRHNQLNQDNLQRICNDAGFLVFALNRGYFAGEFIPGIEFMSIPGIAE